MQPKKLAFPGGVWYDLCQFHALLIIGQKIIYEVQKFMVEAHRDKSVTLTGIAGVLILVYLTNYSLYSETDLVGYISTVLN